jgi:hypothetical protein
MITEYSIHSTGLMTPEQRAQLQLDAEVIADAYSDDAPAVRLASFVIDLLSASKSD